MAVGRDALGDIKGHLLGADVHHGAVLQDEVYVAVEVDGLAIVQRALGHIPACVEAALATREDGEAGALLRVALGIEVGHGWAGGEGAGSVIAVEVVVVVRPHS